MRKKNKEILDPNIIEAILSKNNIVRIAMIDGNEPYIVPLNYGYKDNALYIHCAKEGRKIDILKNNPRVCFEIEGKTELKTRPKACDWTLKFESLIGYSNVEILEDRDEKIAGLDILMKQFDGPQNEYSSKHVDAIVILKMTIESICGKQSN
jgi:hypothetical protein